MLRILAISAAVGGSSCALAQEMTLASLRAGVEAYWGSIETVDVAFTYHMTDADAWQGAARSSNRVVTEAGKFYWEHAYGQNPAFDPRTFTRTVVYDGQRTTSIQTTFGQATIQNGRAPDASTEGKGFFELAMFCPSSGDDVSPGASLLTLVRHARVRMRPAPEEVEGRSCWVLDLPGRSGIGNDVSVWVDASRGFLPMRRVVYDARTGLTPLIEAVIEEAVQLPDGRWLPVKGRRSTPATPGVAGLSNANQWRLEVLRGGNGAYQLQVNADIPDPLFDLESRIPPGFVLANMSTGEVRRVDRGNYNDSARALDAVLVNSPLMLKGVKVQPHASDLSEASSAGLWLVGLASAVVSFGASAGLTRRRDRAR
jgi:hypothetical protein